MSSQPLDLGGAEFWRRPLDERMADFAVLREAGPVHPRRGRTTR